MTLVEAFKLLGPLTGDRETDRQRTEAIRIVHELCGRLAFKFRLQELDREDLVQETVLKTLSSRERRGGSLGQAEIVADQQVVAFFLRALHNNWINWLRKKKPLSGEVNDEQQPQRVVMVSYDPQVDDQESVGGSQSSDADKLLQRIARPDGGAIDKEQREIANSYLEAFYSTLVPECAATVQDRAQNDFVLDFIELRELWAERTTIEEMLAGSGVLRGTDHWSLARDARYARYYRARRRMAAHIKAKRERLELSAEDTRIFLAILDMLKQREADEDGSS